MERCRFCNCMKLREFCENIFDNKQTNPTIPTIVELFTNLKIVENDPYTKFACFNCFNILIIFYHYRVKILETNELLLKNEINTNQNSVEDFHEKWPRIKQCDDGQFVVYNNVSDDDCKTNLRIECDSGDEDNQPLSTLIGDNKIKINYNNDGNLHDNNPSNITANDKLCSTIVTTSDENQGDHKNNRISNDDVKNETIGNNNNNNNNSDKKNINISVLNEQPTGKKLYQCFICKKNFSNDSNLTKHLLRHTRKKCHKCNICDKKFTTKTGLKTHLLRHTRKKCHKCNICHKIFTTSTGLKTHLLIHTGEKPHLCNICGKTFTQSKGLKNHIKTHTGERPYHCDICNKRFTQISDLKRHLNIHTGEKPHQCHICNMRFSLKIYLKKHLVIHSGEKSHQCNVCDKKFTYKGGLIRHLKVHTGEKPHQCDICYKRFIQKGNLKIHLKVHRGEKTLTVFPQSDHLLKVWLKVLKKNSETWTWSKHKVVCSLHFSDEDFIRRGGRNFLKTNAIPNIPGSSDIFTISSESSVLSQPRQTKREQLKRKIRKRKETTEQQHSIMATEGGATKKPDSDPLLLVVEDAAPNVDVIIDCPWDSNAVFQKAESRKCAEDNSEEMYDTFVIDDQRIETPTRDASSRTPKLTRNNRKRAMTAVALEADLRIKKIVEATQQQNELHSLRLRILEAELQNALLARKTAELLKQKAIAEAELSKMQLEEFKKKVEF